VVDTQTAFLHDHLGEGLFSKELEGYQDYLG
jgi:hypothetical protein